MNLDLDNIPNGISLSIIQNGCDVDALIQINNATAEFLEDLCGVHYDD